MHDAPADGLDRQVQNVVGALEYPRYLDRETPLAGVQRARRDQPVVAADELNDLRLVESITLHCEWVDHDLHEFFAGADEVDFEHPVDTLELILEVPGDRRQRALGNVTRKVENEHRVEA
jgi:hypothetical protein